MTTAEITPQLLAKCYFIAYLLYNALIFLVGFTDEYKQSERARIKKGTYCKPSFTELVALFLFIVSCYVK